MFSPATISLSEPEDGFRGNLWLLVSASLAIPLTLLWDYSWESTIGIDLIWSPPHVANYLTVGIAAAAALAGRPRPLGAWLVLWGAVAFLTAVLLDGWWQTSYGLAAGIWGPSQLLKAMALLVIQAGALAASAASGRRWATSCAGAALLLMISMMSLATLYPNRQHAAPFYQIASGAYPLVLTTLAVAGKGRWSATRAAGVYFLGWGMMVWLLPLFPGTPQVTPIFHPRDHLLPPPFPLLLFIPALAIDALLPAGSSGQVKGWRPAVEAGLAFFLLFVASQWFFSGWMLTPAAAHAFFAGGGQHWPFYLQIAPDARTTFWTGPGETLNFLRGLGALALAIVSAYAGLAAGRWLQIIRR